MQIIQIADPVAGEEPGDQVRSFVFMSNLAAQEASGDPDMSVSVERIITDLTGSPELASYLFVATRDEPVALTATVPGYEEPWVEAEGWVKINLPLIDDKDSAAIEIVLDAGHQPLPGEDLTPEATTLVDALLTHAETTAGAAPWSRRILHTAHMHPPALTAGCDHCAVLEHAGYRRAHEEIQQVLDLGNLPTGRDPLKSGGLNIHRITGTSFPESLIAGIVELQDIAATDIPHGSLTTDPARWSPRRLAQQSDRINRTGTQLVTVIITDTEGVAAFSTISLPPGANPEAAEQGLTIVHPRARGQYLGHTVKLACLDLLRDTHPRVKRVATSNAVDNQAMLAINRALGAREVSRTTLWEKVL